MLLLFCSWIRHTCEQVTNLCVMVCDTSCDTSSLTPAGYISLMPGRAKSKKAKRQQEQLLNAQKEQAAANTYQLLGSNDPNTILDLTRVRCSRSCIISYVSIRTPFLFGLSYVYVSFRLCDFPVTSLVTP